jgi:hypothetical protein
LTDIRKYVNMMPEWAEGCVPKTLVVFYKDRQGYVPVLEWLDALPAKIQDK